MNTASPEPMVTALICTRDRAALAADAIRSILLNDYPFFSLMIVDQSEDDRMQAGAAKLLADPRVIYLRSSTRGLSAARNLGICYSRAELIALTDDDCTAGGNWLTEVVAAFAGDKRIGVAFGNVLPGAHDAHEGFIPSYAIEKPFIARGVTDKPRVEGIGACMALRKSVWKALQGFDESLGAGSRFKSAEETDFAIRALLAGYRVYETPRISVVHHGFRTWAQGRELIKGHMYGLGAMFAKLMKCRPWPIVRILSHLAWRWAFARPVVDFGACPPRLMRLKAFLQGSIAGAQARVDRPSCRFCH